MALRATSGWRRSPRWSIGIAGWIRSRPRSKPRSSALLLLAVEPAVLRPGEHHALHVLARLVVGNLLDERLHVARAPRLPPVAHALGPGVVGGDGQARIAELLHETGEERGAQVEVGPRIVEHAAFLEGTPAHVGHRLRRRRHELHEPARAGARHGPRIVAALPAHDGRHEERVQAG